MKIKAIIQKGIHLYQKKGSLYLKQLFLIPNNGCRFYPTCSEYAKIAIIKHGLLIGSFKAIIRIIKCNPLNKGGIDNP